MTVVPAGRCATAALPWLLILYAAASLLHFAHNAQYLAQYPNLPPSWSRAEVYLAWCGLTAAGLAGYLLYRGGHRRAGLTILLVYACLGFAGLLHYQRAPFGRHTAMMNLTIWTEAVAGALLLAAVVSVANAKAKLR
jgi:hypothetical protein